MKKNINQGFTTIELLVTLFIAAAFLASGYQLYSVILQDGGDARAQASCRMINFFCRTF